MTKLKIRHIQTPKSAAYPLVAKEAKVGPGEEVAQGQSLYVFTTADGRNILIKSPWRAQVGPQLLPVGTVIDRPMPFITMQLLPDTASPEAAPKQADKKDTHPPRPQKTRRSSQKVHPDKRARAEAGVEQQRSSGAGKRENAQNKKTNGALAGRWRAAAFTFGIPAALLLAVLVLCEFVLPDFFDDHIVARWALVLLAYLGGTWVGTGFAQRIQPQKNLPSIGATVLVTMMAVFSFLPAELTSEFIGDFQLGNLFKTKAYGVVLEDLNSFSNGATPVQTPQQARDFANWIND